MTSVNEQRNNMGAQAIYPNDAHYKFLRFDIDSDRYDDFVKQIRDTLKQSDFHGIPTLMAQPPSVNMAWLDIKLVAGDRSITVRLDQSNLYLRGYKRSSSTDFFWELSDTSLIPGSRSLSFSGSYASGDGLQKTAGTRREKLSLGLHRLRKAICNLADTVNPIGDNSGTTAQNLLVLTQMIPEAARFIPIADSISAKWLETNGTQIDDRMLALENGWARLSTAVLLLQDPTRTTPLQNIPADDNRILVDTFSQARDTIGILLVGQNNYGRSMMNLEFVLVNNIDDDDPGKLYGKVWVNDGWNTYTFYDRNSSDYESISPGGGAALIEPSYYPRPVSGEDTFFIAVDLCAHHWLFYHDHKIAEGKIYWDRMVQSVSFANYNKHLEHVVKGENGNVTVGYSVISNAFCVTIHVLLINGAGEDPAQVSGTATASLVLPGKVASAPITLFQKSSDQCVEVRQGQAIPLIREVVAGSPSTPLVITVDLHDKKSSNGVAIAKGTVEFQLHTGPQRQFIEGEQVMVKINCN